MKRLRMAMATLALALAAGAATAESLEESIVAQLRAQGYGSVTVSRTLLGRIMIVAEGDDEVREIVVNPNTGEILRDYLRATTTRIARDEDRVQSGTAVMSGDDAAPDEVPERPVLETTSDFGDGPTEIVE